MDIPIALIRVSVKSNSRVGTDQTIPRLYKIEVVSSESSPDDEESVILFEYSSGGYRVLESLGTDISREKAINTAQNRVTDYCLDGSVEQIEVIRRD